MTKPEFSLGEELLGKGMKEAINRHKAPTPAYEARPDPNCARCLGSGKYTTDGWGGNTFKTCECVEAPAPAEGAEQAFHELNTQRYVDHTDFMAGYEAGAASLREQLADSNLAFEHANEVVGKLEKENEGLREALRNLGGHHFTCEINNGLEKPCTCGYEQALAGKES